MTIHGYAAFEAKKPLSKFSYEPGVLGPMEVEIEISHCGICHSDVHLVDNDWSYSQFPFIPGHEIVGTVRALGAAVTNLAKGQRVAVGWQAGACGECEWCLRGEDHLCVRSQPTCVRHHGGFAEAVRADSRFAFSVPESLESEFVGPLMCGGATVYSPLRRFGVQAPMRVGVIGIGGLGHLAVQFAHAMGCEVTAFSTTPGKEEEARRMGAHHFVVTRDPASLDNLKESQDFILCTIFAGQDWAKWLAALRKKGTFCFVGAVAEPIQFPVSSILGGEKCVRASIIANRTVIREMLEFAARTGVKPVIERMAMPDANAALDRVRRNQARYRVVLKN